MIELRLEDIFIHQCKNCSNYKPHNKNNCEMYTALIKRVLEHEKLTPWQVGACTLVFNGGSCQGYNGRNDE